MDIKALKQDFLEALSVINSVVEKKNVMPVLANVLIENRGSSELSLTATDLEVTAIVSIPAQIKKDVHFSVSAKSLFEIVRESDSDEIQMLLAESNRLEIASKQSRYKIFALGAEEFPKIPDIDAKYQKVKAADFNRVVDIVGFAMSQDETRYHLNGMLFEKSEKGLLTAVATDGHRLSLIDFQAGLDLRQNHIIVPRKGINELKKLVSDKEEIEFAVGDKHLFAKTDRRTLFIRLIDGDFPDYKRVVPKDNSIVVTFPRQELTGALKRVSLLSSDRSKGVSFYLCKNSLTVSTSNPELGEAREELEISYSGPVMTIGFNARYFLDALQAIPADKITISFKDELSPCLITIDTDKSFRSVIMPMRL